MLLSDDRPIYWLDLETAGLEPVVHKILEVALYRSKMSMPFAAERMYHAVLRFAPDRSSTSSIEEDAWFIHQKTGLLRECASSTTTYAHVVAALSDLIPITARADERPYLAGSTVHFDRAFLAEQFGPIEDIAGRFHHRHYDVSSVKMFCESIGMPKIEKGNAHRAEADVKESIAHAAKCAEWIASLTETAQHKVASSVLEYVVGP